MAMARRKPGAALFRKATVSVSIPRAWQMIPGKIFGGFSQKIRGRDGVETEIDIEFLQFVNFFQTFSGGCQIGSGDVT